MMEPKKVFIYDDTLKPEEKRRCMNYVAELGGVSKLSNTYVSEATHVVVHDTNNLRLISPKVLGCLASGKHVVTIQYLIQCRIRGSFQNELINSDESVRKIQRSVLRYGKSFRNLTCLVFMHNAEKKRELQTILRDGGAKVPDWTIADLSSKPTLEITNVNKIFTEMEIVSEPDFRTFMATRNRAQWRIDILHHLYIFRFIRTEPNSKERTQIDQYFDINNKEAMKSLQDAMFKYKRKEKLRMIEESRLPGGRKQLNHNNSNVENNNEFRAKRKIDRSDAFEKRTKRQCLELSLDDKGEKKTSMCNINQHKLEMEKCHISKEIEILKLKRDHKGMIQLRIDNIPQFKIKREVKQEIYEKRPEIITLDDSYEDEIKVVQVITKIPLSIRRVRSAIKTENGTLEYEGNRNCVSLSSKPTEIEVKRKIALEDDGMRNILHKLHRQNMCISSTLTNPVAPPTVHDPKVEMPLVLSPGMSQYRNGVKGHHDGANSTFELIELEDSDDEIDSSVKKSSPISRYQVKIEPDKHNKIAQKQSESQLEDDDIIVLSDDEEGPENNVTDRFNSSSQEDLKFRGAIKLHETDKDDKKVVGIASKNELDYLKRDSPERTYAGMLKLRSIKDLTGAVSSKPNVNKIESNSENSSNIHEDLKNSEITNLHLEKITKMKPTSLKKHPTLSSSGKTWGLPDDKCSEIEKQIWESDEEDEIFNENDSLKSIKQTNSKIANNAPKNHCPSYYDAKKVTTQLKMAIQNLDEFNDTTSNYSVESDAETIIDENELNSIAAVELENVIQPNEVTIERMRRNRKQYDTDSKSHESRTTILQNSGIVKTNAQTNLLQYDFQSLIGDTRNYIKAFISRQKITNECVDIADIRPRTNKFDSKKESNLTGNELDERGRPWAEPFNNYITTQLFETTFNCTELIGIAELLDTIIALSSSTCSKYFAR